MNLDELKKEIEDFFFGVDVRVTRQEYLSVYTEFRKNQSLFYNPDDNDLKIETVSGRFDPDELEVIKDEISLLYDVARFIEERESDV